MCQAQKLPRSPEITTTFVRGQRVARQFGKGLHCCRANLSKRVGSGVAMVRLLGCGVLLAVSSAACGVGLSSNQPAHVPEKGHAHAEVGVDVSYPTGTIPD